MIQGIILDVDGVIIGSKPSENVPHPHPDVLQKLKGIQQSGIPICLCTARPYFSVMDIVEDAELWSPHISNAGADIVDGKTETLLQQYTIPSDLVSEVLETYLQNDVYTEVGLFDGYHIQKNQLGKLTDEHALIISSMPETHESLLDFAIEQSVSKLLLVCEGEAEKDRLNAMFEPFADQLMISWAVHPLILPLQFGNITMKGISKSRGSKDALAHLGIDFADVLAVGDGIHDWQFMQHAGYIGMMGNASDELKEASEGCEKEHVYIGPDVDENGILDILEHFLK